MRIFISYSNKDEEFVDKLQSKLLESNIESFDFKTNLKPGETILSTIKEALRNSDYIIFVLSKNSVKSDTVNFEISTVLLNEISKEETLFIPILIEDCEMPYSLNGRFFADFRKSFSSGLDALLFGLKRDKKVSFVEDLTTDEPTLESYSVPIKKLQEAYGNGNLAIFCGAGISFESGIPTWDKLLKELLREVYSDHTLPNVDVKLAELFQKRQNLSPLIVANYLKIGLGENFISTVRDVLYQDYNEPSRAIKEIVALCRPKRNRETLKAIVTFNFDDIIEEQLIKEKIDCLSIFDEGERYNESQIPVYHPHGFLPRKPKELTSKYQIVFSEDAYHSQFIDPFSWSNLVQLNYLSSSTCLFVGISLTDPNMRRLLDVSERKNKHKNKNHYIIKKRYSLKDLFGESAVVSEKNKSLIPLIENIEEKDAYNFGFNMIWINDFNEIPEILKQIGE